MKRYEEMNEQERAEYMEDMTAADRAWDAWKRDGKPATLRQNLLEYEAKMRVMA